MNDRSYDMSVHPHSTCEGLYRDACVALNLPEHVHDDFYLTWSSSALPRSSVTVESVGLARGCRVHFVPRGRGGVRKGRAKAGNKTMTTKETRDAS